MVSLSSGKRVCENRECQADADCGPGAACRDIGLWPGKKGEVGRCVPHGLRKEGESCVSNTVLEISQSCAQGLLCLNHQCGRPCDPKNSECEAIGATCEPLHDERQQSVCYKSCKPGDCAGNLECVSTGRTAHCAERVGPNCTTQRCPSGSQCQVQDNGSKVAFACRPLCTREGKCPASQVCANLYGTWESGDLGVPLCYEACSREKPECPGGQLCIPIDSQQKTFGCRYIF